MEHTIENVYPDNMDGINLPTCSLHNVSISCCKLSVQLNHMYMFNIKSRYRLLGLYSCVTVTTRTNQTLCTARGQ